MQFFDDEPETCPFCEHAYDIYDLVIISPYDAEWRGRPCPHVLFVAVDSPACCKFLHRSSAFNRYLEVPDDPYEEVFVPSDDNDGDPMSFQELVERIDLPNFQYTEICNGFGILYIGFQSQATTNP